MSHVGRVLAGRYRLTRQLGRGGMGSVWEAEHLGLRSSVAVKLIEPAIAEDPEALGRFMREAQAAAALRSPHVVQVLDYGVDGDTPYIAMEVLEGETLRARLEREGRLSVEDTARLLTQLARALSRAHDAGIVHRDMKPENVFLIRNDDEEVAKVLDFGVAKASLGSAEAGFAATRTGTMLGTPYYMSPEQVEGKKQIDGRTDIWSIGVIAFECLIGQKPFLGETLGALFLAICTHPIVVPSRLAAVPAGFDAWFARSTARDPALRFATAKEQSTAFRQIVESSSFRHQQPSGDGSSSGAARDVSAAVTNNPETRILMTTGGSVL